MTSSNPFTPGYGSQPPLLAGRDDLLQRTMDAYRSGPGHPDYHLALHGPRGVGKTVLADAIAAQTHRQLHWMVLSVSGLSDVEVPDEIARQATDASRRRGRRPRQLDAEPTVGVNLGVVKGELSAKHRDRPPPTVEAALIALGEYAAAKHLGAIVVIDEVQAVPARPQLRAVAAALQSTRRRALPIAAVLTGLPSTPDHLIEAGTFTERMAKQPLGYLGEDATRLALLQPIVTRGATITPAALDAAARATRGYPYFVQLYGFHCWRLADGRNINEDHVDRAALVVAAEVAANLYQPRMARLSALERAYLRAVAEHGERFVPSADVARTLGRSARQLSSTREALIADHNILLSEQPQTVSFAVPGFAEWLRAAGPLVVPSIRRGSPNRRQVTPRYDIGPDPEKPTAAGVDAASQGTAATPTSSDSPSESDRSQNDTYRPRWPTPRPRPPSRSRGDDIGL
ncbi:MAG: ATP-binding protein [Actinomycetota bacterium]|nr:ATP-binding protein [Actinomycetota bacterium]